LTHRRRKGKAYRPTDVLVNPLLAILPAPKADQTAVLLGFHTSLRMLAAGESPTASEWRSLADAINTVETLVTMRELSHDEVMPSVDLAIQAMAAAVKAARAGEGMQLHGGGLDAVRDVVGIYEQALEALPGLVMSRARALTEKRIRDYRLKGATDVEVVEA
jgi:hypothetical protein